MARAPLASALTGQRRAQVLRRRPIAQVPQAIAEDAARVLLAEGPLAVAVHGAGSSTSTSVKCPAGSPRYEAVLVEQPVQVGPADPRLLRRQRHLALRPRHRLPQVAPLE